MEFLLRKKRVRSWSLITSVLVAMQMISGSVSPALAATDPVNATGSADGKIHFVLPTSELHVTANGSFNNWGDPESTPLSDVDGDGIYTADLTGLTPSTAYEYKFLINNTWADDPNLSVTTDEDGAAQLSYEPHFKVIGSFDDPTQGEHPALTKGTDAYELTTDELADGDYTYKYLASADGVPPIWFYDPTNPNRSGDNNTITVGTPEPPAPTSTTAVEPDELAEQPGGKSQWVAVGSFQGWDNASASTQLKHLGADFYEYSAVLDAGHHEFKLVKSGTWGGYDHEGQNFAFDLTETTKVNFYVNEALGQARINLPNVAGLPQYTPSLTEAEWPRLVGNIQTLFNEPEWSPEQAKQYFLDYNFDGTVFKLQRSLPAGDYEAKVVLGNNWSVPNYGGNSNGDNLVLKTVDAADVTFTINLAADNANKILTTNYKPTDGVSDGQIKREMIAFDSRSITYKRPFGAIKEQTEDLTLRIATAAEDVQLARVELTDPKGLSSTYNMHRATSFDERDYWEVNIPSAAFQGIGVWGYKFILIDGATKVEYGDDGVSGGTGATENEGVLPYNLTVYDKNFKTPDWMKNAVVYQIFPDRFFDGNQDNNRAKTVDGYRGGVPLAGEALTTKNAHKLQYFDGGVTNDPTPDQVWGDWADYPESPDRIKPELKPYFPDAKSDGIWTNEFYGGDIQGAQQKIDYLKALGVTVIYLNPVAWAASNHKYDATDYKHLDPMFGEPVYNTPGDPTSGLDYDATRVASDRVFAEFAKAARASGIKLIVDGVFNHVGDDSIYFDRYSKYPEIGAYEFWAQVWDKVNAGMLEAAARQEVIASYTSQVNPATGVNYQYPQDFDFTTWFTVANERVSDGGDAWHYKYDGWWGIDSLPNVDAREPAAGDTEGLPGMHEWNVPGYRDLVIGHDLTGKSDAEADELMQYANSQRWEWLGARGWRLDVAPDVSEGTWQKFRQAVKSTAGRLDSNGEAIDDPIILGEEWGVATKYLLGDQFDSVMNYRFRGALQSFIINGNAQQFHNSLEAIREDYPEEAWQVMLNLVDSHDTIRSITKYDKPEWEEEKNAIAPEASDKALQMQALTAIFQMGYPGAPTVNYGDEVGLTGTKDPDSRRSFPWERVQGANGSYSAAGRYANLFDTYQNAAETRDTNEVFRTGDMKLAYAEGDVIAYARKTDTTAGLVAINRGTTEVTFEADVAGFLPDGVTLQDQLGGSVTGTTVGGRVEVTIPAMSGVMMTSAQALQTLPAVQGVQATGENQRVHVTWDEVPGATGYNLYRAPIEGGQLMFVGSVTTATWSDVNVLNGKKYYYAVTAKNDNGESPLSQFVSATPSFPIQAVEITQQSTPVTLGVGNKTSEILVTVNVPGLTDDAAYAGKEAPNLNARLFYYKEGTSKETALDTKLRYKSDTDDGQKVYWAQFEPTVQGTFYYFGKVSTNNGETWTESAMSYVDVSADTNDTTAPTAPVLAKILVESNRAELKWSNEDTADEVEHLEIYRATTGTDYQLIATLPKTATSYIDFTVNNDTEYTYKVAAVDAAYNRGMSNIESVTPKIVMIDVKLRVHLPGYTPATDDVYIAGTLNGWNQAGGKLNVPSGATTRDVLEYNFKMMAGKSIEYKYTRGTWDTEALTSHTRQANDTEDYGNYAYSSQDTNMKLTIKNQGNNQMLVDDYVLRWVDMPMIVTMPRISYGEKIEYTTAEDDFTLKANVPYGVQFTINGQPLAESDMDAYGNVQVDSIPLAPGVNRLTLHIEPTAETLNQPWYTDKGRAKQATRTLEMEITSTADAVPVTGVTLDKSKLLLTAGGATGQLTAVIAPANATNKQVTWSSSKPEVATVSASGLVTPLKPGHTVITVTTQDGSFTATSIVNVNNAGGNGNGNGGGKGNDTGNGTKPDSSKITVTEQQLKDALQSGGQEQSVSLDINGKSEVLLPVNTAQLLGGKKLELKQGNMIVQAPASVLNQLITQAGSDANGAQIALQVKELAGTAGQELLSKAVQTGRANLSAVSGIYDFQLALVAADGTVRSVLSQFDQPFTLTFDVGDDVNKQQVGVYYLTDDGKIEYVGGTWIDDNTLGVEVDHFSTYAVLEFSKHYIDLAADHWAAKAIQALTAKQVIAGTGDDRFEPERSITRAEFAALLVRTLGLKAAGASSFTDVTADDWYAESVAAAAEAGLVFGRTGTAFAPNETISRQEMAAMLIRAHEHKTGQKAAELAALDFRDAAEISEWAKPSIQASKQLGLLVGNGDGTFVPQGQTTRAESAQVISKLLAE